MNKTQKEKAIDNLVCFERYKEKLTSLKHDLISFINNPDGKPTVKLSTGETALDFDDAWLIIGCKGYSLTMESQFTHLGVPYLRSKKLQNYFDEHPEKKDKVMIEDSDKIINWEIEKLLDAGITITRLIEKYLNESNNEM